jgi:hypothetical protein
MYAIFKALTGAKARRRRSDRVHCARRNQAAMMRRMFIILLAAVAVAGPATAQRGLGSTWAPEGEGREEQRAERDVPLSSILRELRMRYGGQHLDARKMGDRYVISWITQDGRRLVIEVDSATGRVISERG